MAFALLVCALVWYVAAASVSAAQDAGGDDNVAPQTVQQVRIDDPTEERLLQALPEDFDVTFFTSANHVWGRYRANIRIEGPERVDLAVRTVLLPVVGGEWAEVTQTETVTVPAGTKPGLYTLCVHVEENWPPGSETWGFDGTDCAPDVIRIGAILDGVEFTQATQELQGLDELEAEGPQVPIVRDRPAVMRVYTGEVAEPTPVRIEVTGSFSGDRTVTLSPACTPKQRRTQQRGCLSHDFPFVPDGDVSVTVRALDPEGGELERRVFDFATTTVEPLRIHPVSVCDDFDGSWPNRDWQCADHSELGGLLGFTRATFPGEVRLESPGGTVGNATADPDWWSDVLRSVRRRWAWSLPPRPSDRYYYGMVRGEAGTGSGIIGLAYRPGHAGVSRTAFTVDGVDGAPGVVAHELGHNFGRQHVPSPAADCFGAPASLDPGWPHGNDPGIQELGFDLRTRTAIDPGGHYDYMSYCLPMWVSPYTYTAVIEEFGGDVGSAGTPSAAEPAELTTGEFWLVSGIIIDGTVELEPLFRDEITADSGAGEGDYRIEARGAGDEVLVSRAFDPEHPHGQDLELPPDFAEWVEFSDDAVRLVVIGPGEQLLGSVDLVGEPPTVAITAPEGSEVLDGLHALEWTVDDPDSAEHTFVVHYSRNGGESWELVEAGLVEPGMGVDFDTLGGSQDTDSSRVRVLASDGVNVGTAVSAGFTVPTKDPVVAIAEPADGAVVREGDLVWLQGIAFDYEDGSLTDDAAGWQSDRDGALGDGDQLAVTSLSQGTHELTFSATDSDGNTAADSVSITVDGTDPDLSVAVGPDERPEGPGEILVLRTRSVSASIETSLLEIGLTFDTLESTSFDEVDFAPYDTVIVGMDAEQDQPAGLADEDILALRTALDEGTRLVLFGGDPTEQFAEAVNEHLFTVDVTETDWREPESPHLQLVDTEHPLAFELPETHDFVTIAGQERSPSEYMLRVTDLDVSVVAVNGDGHPALFAAEGGSLVVMPQTPWGALWGDPADTALLNQVLANALEVAPVLSGPVQVSIDAEDALSGLAWVDYSLDGGEEWAELAPGDLPTVVTLTDQGPVHLLVRAGDRAGNRAVVGERFVVGETSPVTALEVSPEEATVEVGDTQAFSATATHENTAEVDVTDSAEWHSDDPEVATVDAVGTATGVGEGETNIVATFGEQTASATLVVQDTTPDPDPTPTPTPTPTR
ncbi:MAG: Ig-like domain-containing protein [Egibacteraceae bacterium]